MLYNHVKNAWKEAILAYNTAQSSQDYKNIMETMGQAIIQLSQALQHLEVIDLEGENKSFLVCNCPACTKKKVGCERGSQNFKNCDCAFCREKRARPISDFTRMEILS